MKRRRKTYGSIIKKIQGFSKNIFEDGTRAKDNIILKHTCRKDKPWFTIENE